MDYNKIKTLSTEKGISFTELTSKIGMSRRGLYAAIDNQTLSIATLEKISDILEVPIIEFFNLPQLGWVPISEVDNLNNEIAELKVTLKGAKEQLEDKRLIIEFIKEKNLIPRSVIENEGQPNYEIRDFSIDSLLQELENRLSDADIDKKFEGWFNEWKKTKKK